MLLLAKKVNCEKCDANTRMHANNTNMDAEKIKILYVITQGEWGGAQRYVYDLATNLRPGYDVTVAIGEEPGDHALQKKLEKYSEIKILHLKHLVRAISPIQDLLAVKELHGVFQNLKPDIIHLNSSKAGIIGSLAIKNESSRVVYTAHGWVFDEPLSFLRKRIYLFLEKYTSKNKSAIITLSEHDAKRAEQIGIAKNKINIIANGVPPLIASAQYNWNQNSPIDFKTKFITIANFYPTKGLDVLLAAINSAKEKLSNSLFVIFGDGRERGRLEKLIHDFSLEKNVVLAGFSDSLAISALTSADIFVLPSRKEGLPYTILEALTAQKPIIATKVGGIPGLIENKKSGLLVNPDNVSELAEAMVYAVEHPEEMKALAKNAPSPTSLEQMVAATTSLYLKLLWQRPR